MTRSSFDTFDPRGMMIREEPITSLKDDTSRPTMIERESDDRILES